MRRSLRLPTVLLAALVVALAGCGDDDTGSIPATGSDETRAAETTTTSAAPDTTGPDTTTSDDELVALSGTARVTGSFGDEELDLMLTDDTECAVQELDEESVASVEGETATGERFSLDWARLDENSTTSTVELDGTTWTAGPDVPDTDPPTVRLARDGELSIVGTYQSDGGETREAELLVHCLPDA